MAEWYGLIFEDGFRDLFVLRVVLAIVSLCGLFSFGRVRRLDFCLAAVGLFAGDLLHFLVAEESRLLAELAAAGGRAGFLAPLFRILAQASAVATSFALALALSQAVALLLEEVRSASSASLACGPRRRAWSCRH
jgi:hypothetical protein